MRFSSVKLLTKIISSIIYNDNIVLDKNSSVEGIITVEDIVEKLVGDIFDEFDKK